MNEQECYEMPLPSRSRKVRGVVFGALLVALLSGMLLTLASTDAGIRNFFAATSVGIGTFAFSILLVFIWGAGGVATGKMLGSSTRWGLACGAVAGLLGQGVASLTVLLVGGALPFPPLHFAAYAVLGAVVTSLFAATATYYYEEQAFWEELQELEGRR